MNPTSQDVADRAGVSRSTVSQILNGRASYFSDETKARVASAVTELGYEPSAAGRALARGSSDIVIALIPDTTFGHNLQDIYGALTDELARRGLTLVLRLANHSPDALDRLVKGMSPRAVLTLTKLPDEQRQIITDRGVELIEPEAAGSSDANSQIGAIQARYLIDHGYRHLAYAHLSDERSDPFGGPRERAFIEVCDAAEVRDRRILHLGVTAHDARAALDALGGPGYAVACYNDEIATALLFAAHDRGWRVPEDLALIGMDNTPLAGVTIPPLTTLGYDPVQVTAASLRSLLARLDGSSALERADSGLSIILVERETA
ncbi:LacI family DNA-binding transcriptional regulator [Herbiconiux sp. 11R-BC]|uniref:LacI family DNA-binding transcriptional regulator n=1 Tax=Herbiconiux sp. 11R-BC TaxID=3111637 RepID=UPI003C019737